MRALSVEAGCSLGLPYKVFADRNELVVAILAHEFGLLRELGDELIARAGAATLSRNLRWFTEQVLGLTSVALTREVVADAALAEAVDALFEHHDGDPSLFETIVARYLAVEQDAGRVDAEVDTAAFGFVLGSAIHNLIVSGDAYPRPGRSRLERLFAGVTDRLRST
jgi:AcrR family transcriptional regulator